MMSWGESTANSANAIAVQVPPKWVKRGEKDSPQQTLPYFKDTGMSFIPKLVKSRQGLAIKITSDDQTMNGW